MRKPRELLLVASICGCVLVPCVVSCRAKPSGKASASVGEESRKRDGSDRASAQQMSDEAPPAEKTGGFDGKRAFAHVAKQVSFGPRPAGSDAIGRLQEYIQSELTSYGCKVDTDAFATDKPAGRLAMKNIVAKVQGDKP